MQPLQENQKVHAMDIPEPRLWLMYGITLKHNQHRIPLLLIQMAVNLMQLLLHTAHVQVIPALIVVILQEVPALFQP